MTFRPKRDRTNCLKSNPIKAIRRTRRNFLTPLIIFDNGWLRMVLKKRKGTRGTKKYQLTFKSMRKLHKKPVLTFIVHDTSRICNTNTSYLSTSGLGHYASSSRLRSTGIVPLSPERHPVDWTDAAASDEICEEFQKVTVSRTPPLPSMQRHILLATLMTVYKLYHGYLNLSAEEFVKAKTEAFP